MKSYKVTVNGTLYNVTVESQDASVPTKQAAAPVSVSAPEPLKIPETPAAPAPSAIAEGFRLESPMPGVIVNILVKTGDTVTKNQSVVTLEAMKMENEISAPIAGVISSIAVNKGDSVEAGALLLTIKA